MATGRVKRMSGKSAAVLIAFIVAGAVFGTALYVFLGTKRNTVYIFNGSYPAGTVVTGRMFEDMQIDSGLYKKLQTSGQAVYLSADEINESIARKERLVADVVEGLPATSNLFAGNVALGVETRLADYMVAAELDADSVGGMAGNEIYAGGAVNILSSERKNGKVRTEVLFENVPVLGSVKGEDGNIEAIYLELEPAASIELENAKATKMLSVNIVKPGAYLELEGTNNFAISEDGNPAATVAAAEEKAE